MNAADNHECFIFFFFFFFFFFFLPDPTWEFSRRPPVYSSLDKWKQIRPHSPPPDLGDCRKSTRVPDWFVDPVSIARSNILAA